MKVIAQGNGTAREVNQDPVIIRGVIHKREDETIEQARERYKTLPIFTPDGRPYTEAGEVEVEKVKNWLRLDEGTGGDLYQERYVILTEAEEPKAMGGLNEKFFELAHFSDVPVVNEYFKAKKMMYHDGNITKAIEDFANWQAKNAKLIEREKVIEILEKMIAEVEPESNKLLNHQMVVLNTLKNVLQQIKSL
jgi:hypothetical protein